MGTTLHASLTPALKRKPAPSTVEVLDVAGPVACLGGGRGADNLAVPIKADSQSLFGPRGACLIAPEGPLWICDTGHHRLLGWACAPRVDEPAADWVIGQPDMLHEGRNAHGGAHAASFNVPTGIAPCGEGMAVADAWNHRVLVWRRVPRDHNIPADLVLGQADFSGMEGNRGAAAASAGSLFWPSGVSWDGTRLWVADTGNRRVLMWQGLPREHGQSADLVLGQNHFQARDENGGGEPSASSMRWPHGIASWEGRLCITDAGNNRILVWDGVPSRDNAPSAHVLGQRDFQSVDHNQSLYWPSAATLQMPYGIAVAGRWCIAADTANSRLIAWSLEACRTGACAGALTGQSEFTAKGDNAWRLPTRQSLSWPYGITTCGELAVIADSGNNRVLLWRLSRALST
jgi:hypothetical protein